MSRRIFRCLHCGNVYFTDPQAALRHLDEVHGREESMTNHPCNQPPTTKEKT